MAILSKAQLKSHSIAVNVTKTVFKINDAKVAVPHALVVAAAAEIKAASRLSLITLDHTRVKNVKQAFKIGCKKK